MLFISSLLSLKYELDLDKLMYENKLRDNFLHKDKIIVHEKSILAGI